jgi:hypothetical protein
MNVLKILALLPAALMGATAFADADPLNFSVECRGGNVHSGQFQAERISIPLDGGSRKISLRKVKTASAFAEFDKGNGTVAVGYDGGTNLGMHLAAFAKADVSPGAKVQFHQTFPAGNELDCTGIVE